MGEFPFLGIWSAKRLLILSASNHGAEIADSVSSNQQLEQKGRHRKNWVQVKIFSRQWRVKVFY